MFFLSRAGAYIASIVNDILLAQMDARLESRRDAAGGAGHEFRLLLNNGCTRVATSPPVTVTP